MGGRIKNTETDPTTGAREERAAAAAAASAVGDVRSGRDCGGRYGTASPCDVLFSRLVFARTVKATERGKEGGRLATAARTLSALKAAVIPPVGPAKR